MIEQFDELPCYEIVSTLYKCSTCQSVIFVGGKNENYFDFLLFIIKCSTIDTYIITQFILIIPPKRSLGGYIGVTRWLVGRLVGRSAVGPAVQRSVAFSFSNTTSYNDQAHGEKVQCTRKITPS